MRVENSCKRVGTKQASKARIYCGVQEIYCVKRPRGDERAQPDDLGKDPGQVGPDSAGQSGDPQRLSAIEDAANESDQELAASAQALEAAAVEGVEDASDHPERHVHTNL